MDMVCIPLDGRTVTKTETDLHLKQLRRYAYDPQLQLFPDQKEEAHKRELREAFESGKLRVSSTDEYLTRLGLL